MKGSGIFNSFPKKLKRHFAALFIVLAFLPILGIRYSQKGYYVVLPVQFKRTDVPYVNVVIEGASFPLAIDLGSRFEMDLYGDVLKGFKKSRKRIEHWKNLHGDEFQGKIYVLPEIHMGSLTFKRPEVVKFYREESEKYLIWRDPSYQREVDQTVGSLGRGLLRKVNLLLDMKHSKIIATNDLDKLKKEGYNLQSYTKVPFVLDPRGMVIEVGTDLGRKRFIIDSGCTLTMVQKFLQPKDSEELAKRCGCPMLISNKFSMKGVDFGAQELYFHSMTKELDGIDGFLGMDFIKNHVMYIDFPKKIICIHKA